MDVCRLLSPNHYIGKASYLSSGLFNDPLYNLNEFKKLKVVICGAGGFIGGHLVKDLLEKGFSDIRAVDIKPFHQWQQQFMKADNRQKDLRDFENCKGVLNKAAFVFNLAADLGGIDFLENNKSLCMLNVLINTNLLRAAVKNGVKRYFFASSACVYPLDRHNTNHPLPLKESDSYPALPEDGYGWEKLFSERMCKHFREDFGLETRIARFHNVYGPEGVFEGGREKAPAAICRKVIMALLSGNHSIDIWGDGTQLRTFTYIDDCLKGIYDITFSDYHGPLNLGSCEMISINKLVDIVEDIACIELKRNYDLSAPKGVSGRSSDNTLIKSVLGWEPEVKIRTGIKKTYTWIYMQLAKKIKKLPLLGTKVRNQVSQDPKLLIPTLHS